MDDLTHMDTVAVRKAGVDGWLPYGYESVAGGIIIKGGIPRLLLSGKRKGRPTWESCKSPSTVIVTHEEIKARETAFEAETGKCSTCYGKGEVFASWDHIEGTKYRKCGVCAGSGIAAIGKEPAK